MPDPVPAAWWVFVLVGLTVLIVAAAFGVAMVASQRRVITLHREHARHLLRTQEEERAWVAREVHDDVLQHVMLISREVEEAARATAGGPERLLAIHDEIDDLGRALRALAHRLHPPVLDRGGLLTALRDLAAEAGRTYGLTVSADIPESIPVPTAERSLALYRIAQEALRNVSRHAGVEDAAVRVTSDGRTIQLAIQDTGRGMVSDSGTSPAGIGIINMQERAALAGGRLDLRSEPGGGTTVRVTVPLGEEGQA